MENGLLTPCYWLCQDDKPEGYGYMKRQIERLIKEMVRRNVARFNPGKVILFGSNARGLVDVNKFVIVGIEP